MEIPNFAAAWLVRRPLGGLSTGLAAGEVVPDPGRPEDDPAAVAALAEYTSYLGKTDEDMWRDLRTTRGLRREHEHYLRRFDANVLAAYRQHAIAARGAVDLLDWLTARGLPLAVASSSRAVGRDLPRHPVTNK